MSFNINELISNLDSVNGFLIPNHFYVTISSPQWLTSGSNDALSLIPFLCDSTELPGMTYQTTDIMHQGIGITEKRPTNAIFDLQPLTFYCDAKGTILNFFEQWFQNINNFNTNTGTNNALNNLKMFEFQYPTQYEATIDIFSMDRAGNQVLHYQLLNAFPVIKGKVQVDWSGETTVMRLNIMFAYRHWTSDAIQVGSSSTVYATFDQAVTASALGVNPISNLVYTLGTALLPSQIAMIVNATLGSTVYGSLNTLLGV